MNEKYKTRKRKGKRQFYWVYTDPYSGKQKEIASYVKATLDKKVEAKKKELALGPQGMRPFGDYLSDWLENIHLVGKRPRTAEKYRDALKKIKDSDISTVPIGKLDDRRIQAFYNAYFKQNGSASQVKSLHKIIRPCIAYAAIRGDIRVNFMELVKLPKDRAEVRRARRLKAEDRALTHKEQDKLSAYLFENVMKERFASQCMVLLVGLYMGTRIGESLDLRWRDVKKVSDVMCIDINKQVQRVAVPQPDGTVKYKFQEGEPKSDYGYRKLAIPDVILPTFLNYKKMQKAAYEKLMIPWNEDTLVFGTITGSFKEEQSVNRYLKRACKKIGIKLHHTHDLRHTFITNAFEAGLSVKDVQMLAGDGSTEMLMRVYVHVSEERKIKSMQKIYSDSHDELRLLRPSDVESSGISRVSVKQ